jgi:hypothetical protein
MMWKQFSVLLVSSLSVNDAFVARPPLSKPLTQNTKLFVGQSLPEQPDSGSPATVFGRPLSDETKKLNKQFVYMIKEMVFDTIFAEDTTERAFARFWALETIARMPYFSYLSVLHFYETLGWWRKSDYLRIHFEETWNEEQ